MKSSTRYASIGQNLYGVAYDCWKYLTFRGTATEKLLCSGMCLLQKEEIRRIDENFYV